MSCKIQFLKKQVIYIIIILSITVLNSLVIKKATASNYDVENIIISENFSKNFQKEDVFDKAFRLAFDQLILTLLTSNDKKKIQNTDIFTIKRLIDSFNIENERFINNNYSANFSVSFNKKDSLSFFEAKNIFPSIPKKIDLLLIPILIEKNITDIKYFSDNEIYKNWNIKNEHHYLINYILPSDEIEDREIINNNYKNIESFDFKDIINKYNLNNYIILLVNENSNIIQVLSKIFLNENYEIINVSYENLNLKNKKNLHFIISDLKKKFEDTWKNLNIINSSIKLPITISIDSKNNNKIEEFEIFTNNFDLVYSTKILMFNNNYISYKLIFNGSPNIFFEEAKKNGFIFKKKNQNWIMK